MKRWGLVLWVCIALWAAALAGPGAAHAQWQGSPSSPAAPPTGTGTLGDVTAGGTNGTLHYFSVNDEQNPKAPQFGAVNGRLADSLQDCTMTSGDATLSCPGAAFTSADAGKAIIVWGAGTDDQLVGYGVNSGSINLTTGAISITYRSAVKNAVPIKVTYESGTTWYTETVGTGNGSTTSFGPYTALHTPVVQYSALVSAGTAINAFDTFTDLVTTVSSVTDATHLVLAAPASRSVSADGHGSDNLGHAFLFTDAATAFNNAITAAKSAVQTCYAEGGFTTSCNATVKIPPGSYGVSSAITIGQANHLNFDASKATIYCAVAGSCLTLGVDSSHSSVDVRIAANLKGTILAGAPTVGVDSRYTQGTNTTGEAKNFAIGYQIGVPATNGGTNSNATLNVVNATSDGIGILFIKCDTCSLSHWLGFGAGDRPAVLGDPANGVLADTSSVGTLDAFKESVGQASVGVAPWLGGVTGLDLGNIIGGVIDSFYAEIFSANGASGIRMGASGGNLNTTTIIGGLLSQNLATAAGNAIEMDSTFFVQQPVIVGTAAVGKWNNGIVCSGTTSGALIFNPRLTGFSNNPTTAYSGCTGAIATIFDQGLQAAFSGAGAPGFNQTFNLQPVFKGAGATPLQVEKNTDSNARLQYTPGTGLQIGTGAATPATVMFEAAPTVSSGFGTSPSIANNAGSNSFSVNVGTGGTATSGVIGLPAATNGWTCNCQDITTTSSTVFLTRETASATNSCTVGNFNTSGAAAAWAASDILSCTAAPR